MRARRPVWVHVAAVAVAAAGVTGSCSAGRSRPAVPAPPIGVATVATVDTSNRAGWWTPIVERGGAIYYAYAAPGEAPRRHTVVVVRRERSGATESRCLRAGAPCIQFRDDVGHNQPSVAVDGEGFVHVFVAMHSSPWRGHYFRSHAPGAVARFTDRGGEMPDPSWTHTYPVPVTAPDGGLWLTIRSRSSPDALGVGGRLYHYDLATRRWSRVATFAYNPGLWVYPDDVQIDPDGRLHIAFEWVKKFTNAFPHVGGHVTYDPATRRFANAAGQPLAAPLDFASPAVYQGWPDSYDPTARYNGLGVQTAKLALDPGTGRPHIVYRYTPRYGDNLRVLHVWWNGTRWRRATVYAGRYDTFPAVDVTLVGTSLRVYYVKENTSGGPAAFVAERTGTGTYTERSLAPGWPAIERLSAIVRPDGTDIAYLSAPQAFGALGGELGLATVPRRWRGPVRRSGFGGDGGPPYFARSEIPPPGGAGACTVGPHDAEQ